MTVHTFLLGSTISTLVSGSIWLLILFLLDPTQAGMLGYVLFFLSLFLFLASLIGLLGYGVRRLVKADQLAAYRVRSALRQGIMIALFSCLLLLLIRFRLYQWWVAVILTILFVSAELVFFGYDKTLDRRTK